jgi:hypothetical protein
VGARPRHQRGESRDEGEGEWIEGVAPASEAGEEQLELLLPMAELRVFGPTS